MTNKNHKKRQKEGICSFATGQNLHSSKRIVKRKANEGERCKIFDCANEEQAKINQAHVAEEPCFQNISETDAMPRQNDLTEQEESFSSAHASMLLRK